MPSLRRTKPSRARHLEGRLRRQRVKPRSGSPAAPALPPAVRGAAGGLFRFAALVVAASLLLLAGWALVATSPVFAVKEVEVLGTRHLSRLEILRASGIGAGSNLLALPVARLEKRIGELGWVASVRVVRRLPGAVRITVRERRPFCLALVKGRLYYLDHELRSFAPVGRERIPSLPVITGLTPADLVSPDQEMEGLLAGARRLLTLSASPGRWGHLGEIHLDRVWGLTAVWEGLPAPVRLGFSSFAARLQRLARVTRDLAQRGELSRALLIDLDHPRRVVVRLARDTVQRT